MLYQGLLFLTRSTCVIVDARSHTCKSHDFIPRYDIISMIKWPCHSCCYYYYSYYYHLLFFIIVIIIFIIINIFMMCRFNEYAGFTWSSCHAVLSDFFWTAATGAGLFTSNSAQCHADHCVQAARALCWERVSLTWIPVGTECWLLINQIREISLMQWPGPVR